MRSSRNRHQATSRSSTAGFDDIGLPMEGRLRPHRTSGSQPRALARMYAHTQNPCDLDHVKYSCGLPTCPGQLTAQPPLTSLHTTEEPMPQMLCWHSQGRSPAKVIDSDARTEDLRDIRPRHHIASKPSTVALHSLRSTPGAADEGRRWNEWSIFRVKNGRTGTTWR